MLPRSIRNKINNETNSCFMWFLGLSVFFLHSSSGLLITNNEAKACFVYSYASLYCFTLVSNGSLCCLPWIFMSFHSCSQWFSIEFRRFFFQHRPSKTFGRHLLFPFIFLFRTIEKHWPDTLFIEITFVFVLYYVVLDTLSIALNTSPAVRSLSWFISQTFHPYLCSSPDNYI